MIVRTQMTFLATGTHFTPSKASAPFSEAYDPGVVDPVGRYRGLPVPYGSADLSVPEDVPDKIAYVHDRMRPLLADLRAAGAEEFELHITYHYDVQCAIGLSSSELRMLAELGCDVAVDCLLADNGEASDALTDAPSSIRSSPQ
jgi:hypothetical protein